VSRKESSIGEVFSGDDRLAFRYIAFDPEGSPGAAILDPGARLGDFVVEHEIGRGGMSVVYRARQDSLGRAVALKVTPEPPASLDSNRIARIEREARVLASLRHEGIVAVHAAGAARGFRWVAMDLVEGTTLRDIVAGRVEGWPNPGGPSWVRHALELLHRVASALAAAHARGVIHRDVKPENVLVGRDRRPVLADFGLARDAVPTGMTMTRGFVGTPRYASPEQARGEPLFPSSDVFSFGLLAFETLTGVPPFREAPSGKLLDWIQWRDVAWPARPRVPRDVRAVVDRCLEKRAQDRYEDARGVEDDLSRVLRFEPVTAVARGRLSRVLRRASLRPRRLLFALSAPAVIAAALASGAILGQGGSADARRFEAEARTEEARRFLVQGDLERAEAILREVVAKGGPPSGARGLLADRHLRRGEMAPARALYLAEIAGGSTTPADRIGAHISEASLRGADLASPADFGASLSARDHALSAELCKRRGETGDAVSALDRAVESEPSAFEWRLERALLLSRERRYERAIADFQIVRDRPSFGRAERNEFARILMKLERWEEAESLLGASLASDPDDAVALAQLSLVVKSWGRPAEASPLIERAVLLGPDVPYVLATAAAHLSFQQDHDGARAFVREATERLGAKTDLAHRSMLIEFMDGRLDAAEPLARSLLDDPIVGPEALEVLAHVLERTSREAEAERLYPDLRRRDPENPEWAIQMGHMFARQGRHEEAEAAFRDAVALDPTRPDCLYGLGWVLRREGRTWDAVLVYDRALALDAGRGETHYWLADAWLDLGYPDVALMYLAKALDQHPTWFDAWALRGVCATRKGDLTLAEASFRHALELKPRHAPVTADLADILDRLGRDREALETYRRARELDPALPTAWCGEGVLRLESDDPDVADPEEAVRLLERAVELRPDDPEYRSLLERARKR